MTPETFFKELKSLKEDNVALVESLKSAVKCTFVQKFNAGQERPCESSDFLEQKGFLERDVLYIKLSLEELINSGYFSKCGKKIEHLSVVKEKICTQSEIDNELLALILIVCGENVCHMPWNTENTVVNCKAIFSLLLKFFNCKEMSELLSKFHKDLRKNILNIIQPKLLADTWKHFPATVACYHWILENIEQPELHSYLPSVLPTALLLVDDFVYENRIVGVKCLHHIIKNVTIAELQFHGYGDVIYHAVMPLLRIRDLNIMHATMPCVITLTSKLEISFGDKSVGKWSRFDEILEIYLENMELEQSSDLRNCYLENLELLIHTSGEVIIRWSKRLLRIFTEYVQAPEGCHSENTILKCLRVMEKYLEMSKPVVHLHCKQILLILVLAFHKTKSQHECETQDVLIRCVRIIEESFSEKDKMELKNELKENIDANNAFLNFCKFVKWPL